MTTPSKNKNSAPKLTPSFANDEDETTAKRENEALDDKNTMEVDCNELKPPSSSDMETHSRVIKLDRNEPDCVGPFIASRCRRQHFPKSSPVESIGSKMADGKENGMVQGESGSGVPVGASDSGIQKKISEVPTYSNYRPIVANGPGLQCRKSFLQDGQHRPFKNIGPALEEVKNLKVGRFDEWKPPAALNIDGPFDLGQVQYVIGREPDTTNDLILPSMGLSSGPPCRLTTLPTQIAVESIRSETVASTTKDTFQEEHESVVHVDTDDSIVQSVKRSRISPTSPSSQNGTNASALSQQTNNVGLQVPSGWGNLFSSQNDKWKCGTCFVRNEQELQQCAACETARP